VLWTNEENGLTGANAYRDAHLAEMDNHVLAIESDGGTFAPRAFGLTSTHDAYARLLGMAPLLQPLVEGDTPIRRGGGGADISPLMRHGVPGMGLLVEPDLYFHYHHTHADTPDKVDPRELARNVAMMAIMSYVAADMPDRLDRDYVTPSE
jgi:carboxypeptidase Q